MRRILSSDAPISLLVTLWLATLVSCNSQSVTEKLATFHKPLVGVPRINSPGLSPILHHLPLRDGKVLGYLFTGTTKNVLAGLDPVGGSVVWRHILDDDDILDEFRPNHDGIIALSGYELQNVRLHEVKNGNIIWEAQLPATQADRLPDFQCIGSCITFATDGTPDVFISSNTGGIHRLNGLTGATKWTWTPVDYAPITPLSKVIATPTKIYFIHFLESSGSYKIHITTINQENGEQLSTQALSASVSDPISDAILVGNPKSNQATLVWAGQDEAKFIRLSTLQEGTAPQSLAGYKKVADTRLGPNGLFVALKADGSSAIMRLDPEDSQWIKTHWAFKDSASSPSRSESIFTGGFDKQGRPHVSRTYWSNRVRACSVELYVPHDNISTGFNFPFDTVHHGVILHSTMDVAIDKRGEIVPRSIFTTSSGSFQMWQKLTPYWTREEALSHIASAAYIKLPHLVGENVAEKNRLSSQLGELTRAPFNALSGISKAVRSIIHPSSASGNSTVLDERFGFRHLIVAATNFGKILALDSTTGDVVWSHLLSISDASGLPLNSEMRILVSNSETEGTTTDVFLIARSPADDQSLVFHLHPLTGESLGSVKTRGFISPQSQFATNVVDAAIIGNNPARLIMIDEAHEAHSYPASSKDLEWASQLTFMVPSPDTSQIFGFKLQEYQEKSLIEVEAIQAWSISLRQDEAIHEIVKPRSQYPILPLSVRNATASKSNENLVGIISSTERSATMANCIVRLVDGVKGTLLYRAELGPGRCEDVKAVFVGDLFVYTHQDTTASSDSAKGWRITTVDLPPAGQLSANSRERLQQRTFAVGFQPRFLATTLTKYGIALEDLIVATDKDQIVTVPNRLLHTLGAAPPAAKSGSSPPAVNILLDDPRLTISQIWQVSDVEGILTTSSQLESTSLVFTYGRDLFGTTVAPSATFDLLSEDFSRSQLFTTLAVLLVAVLMTKPLAQNRELQKLWFTS